MMTDTAIATDAIRCVGLRSRKHIAPFSLIRPTTVSAACAAHRMMGRNTFMAGGLDLVDRMKYGEAFDRVIFLDGVAALHGIRKSDTQIIIGALTTHAQIVRSDVLMRIVPDLPALWADIANPRVRHTGTIGGNLMSGLPHYDAAPAFLALDAMATVSRGTARRTVGMGALLAHENELLESVTIKTAPITHLLTDRSLHPIVSLYVATRSSETGELISARIAVGCAYARPAMVDLPIANNSLHDVANNAGHLARYVLERLSAPIEDKLASSHYRRRMIEVVTRRLLVRLGAVT
jgi:aerobic carbon-monoxide dehydrogenase medium subunit